MLQGVCVDTGLSALLQEGKTYFLREHGNNHYYVGNFENPKSYFGIFSKNRFELLSKQKPELSRYIAKVSKEYSWYTLGDEYIITEKDHNGYFHVYLSYNPSGAPIGSYLKNFFEVIEPFIIEKEFMEIEDTQDRKDTEDEIQTEQKDEELEKETKTSMNQLDLFDFI